MSGASSRSLGKGSAPPGPVPEGKVRVYSMRFCPFAERVLMVLQAKGIGHEIININLKNKPEWFLKKNPSGMVPVLETSQGHIISDSAIICEYLDEAYPQKKLFPVDPYKKTRQKMTLQLFSKVPPLVRSVITVKRKEDYPSIREELKKELMKLEEELSETTNFLGERFPSMIDYLMWPWFQRLEALDLSECIVPTPKLKVWMAAMQKDPIVVSHLIDAETFRTFLSLYLQDSLEACDYGL
ncbi:glutathione S-transferase omega-1 [Acomys russatus]|uniref:glutathione S-transferase omega-1 n=1 Tax=Acomys russatus TaxID=60746 RepID=UPI0021E3302E|nr:glutathione S-transferase omega-1 [Acomys russatus]